MSCREKENEYEVYICNYLNKEKGTAWLWKNIPMKHLLNSGLYHDLNKPKTNKSKNTNPINDTGIDILLLSNNEYIFVQCKNTCTLYMKELGGYSFMMSNHENKKGIVYHTGKLSSNIKKNSITNRLTFIKKQMIENKIINKPENAHISLSRNKIKEPKKENEQNKTLSIDVIIEDSHKKQREFGNYKLIKTSKSPRDTHIIERINTIHNKNMLWNDFFKDEYYLSIKIKNREGQNKNYNLDKLRKDIKNGYLTLCRFE